MIKRESGLISCMMTIWMMMWFGMVTGQEHIPYSLEKPDATYEMPAVLEEISGIHLMEDSRFACIQDEKGIIFLYDTAQRNIVQEISFDKDKDYEDIEIIGNDAWVLESDGDLRMVVNFCEENPEVIRYDTKLSSANDAEGLTYHKPSHSLLIACKGSASISDDINLEGYRAVYRFDLHSGELFASPMMLIKLDDLLDYSSLNAFAKLSYKLAALLDTNGDIRFQPSGIAIHPETGDIYILSFTSAMLAVYDFNGKLKAAANLNKRIFLQPEGICFDNQNNLYISNEGNGGTANILKFTRNQ